MPAAWPSGSITGRRARGNVTVGATWQANAASAITLATGTSGTVSVRNPMFAGSFTFVDATTGAAVPVTRNGDTISFTATAGKPYRATSGATTTRYEAETWPAICTGTIDSNWPGYSGTGFCNGDSAVGAYAQFTANAPAAGTATLRVRFANGTTTGRPASLIVNGATVSTPSFEGTGAWSTWVIKTLTVSVNAGTNTIRFNPTTSNGLPNIDYLDFSVP